MFSRTSRHDPHAPGSRALRTRLTQRLLASVAALFALALVGTYQLGATAATVPEPDVNTAAQKLSVSATAAATPVVRDDYEVVEFSLVRWPVNPGSFSGGWGPRSCAGCSSFHKGIDLNAGFGTPIAAIADGVVVSIDATGAALGHHVIIGHVIDGVPVYSVYAHLQYGSSPMVVGQEVTQGDLVGLIGQTGQATAPHLHFALMTNECCDYFDPMPWMQQHVTVPWGS